MLIVLDTNVFQADLAMGTGNFAILFDYLRKTNSRVVMPQIVLEELTANVKREVESRLNGYLRAKGQLDAVLPVPTKDFHVDVEKAAGDYMSALKRKLNLLDNEVVPYRPEYLADVLQR